MEAIIELPYQPKPGVTHIICEEHYRLGGGAANVAEWLGSWDVPTRLCGYAIGYDAYGEQLWGWLSEYPAIDLSYVKRQKGIRTLVARSIPFPDGSKYLFCSDFAKATLVQPTEELLSEVGTLEIAFYYGNPRGNAVAADLARLAYSKGIKIVAMDLLSRKVETLPMVDIIINSVESIREQYPNVNILEHSRELQAVSQGVVITTNGNCEINAIGRDGRLYTALPPKVMPVETTGAGDSFRAGIIYGLLQQWPLERSLQWAAAVGAMQVQRSLGQDRPVSIEEIARLAEKVEVRRKI